MSISVIESGKEPEIDWDEVQKILKDISRVENDFRSRGVDGNSFVVASLISVMNLSTLAMRGDMFQSFVYIIDLMRVLWPSISQAIKQQTEEALELSKTEKGSKDMTEADIDTLNKILININMLEVSRSNLTAEDIVNVLNTQNSINDRLKDWASDAKRDVLMRTLIVMAQQLAFFEMNGNVAAAKAAFVDQQQLLWPIALENSKGIIEKEVEITKDSSN
jgi:hypothetical protein